MGRNFFGNELVSPNTKESVRKNCEYLNDLLVEAGKMYLGGFRLSKYLNPGNKFFRIMQLHSGLKLGCEASVISMLALKEIPSAKLVQGKYDGSIHAWVEFLFGNTEFVSDLIECDSFAVLKKKYYNSPHGVEKEWVCKYNDFWGLPLSKSLYANMQERETSRGLFEYLSEYHRACSCDGYGFEKGVLSEVREPEFFIPFKRNGKIFSEGVFKDILTKGWVAPKTLAAASELLSDIESVVI